MPIRLLEGALLHRDLHLKLQLGAEYDPSLRRPHSRASSIQQESDYDGASQVQSDVGVFS